MMKTLNLMKKTMMLFLAVIMFVALVPTTVQAGRLEFYVNEGWRRYPMPATYDFLRLINNIGDAPDGESRFLNNPQDFMIGPNGNLFIADTGNSRIVEMTLDGELVNIFRGPEGNQLRNPQGIFVHNTGSLFIADTANSRIVHLDAQGGWIEQFVIPESELLGDNRSFAVTKLVVNDIGFIHVIRGESIMIIDGYNEFRGFLGQVNIGFNIVEFLIRLFGTEAQQQFITRRYAAAFTNLALDAEGMIFATSRDDRFGEIKRLNSVGNNIFREYTGARDDMGNPVWRFIRDFIRGEGRLRPAFRFGERRTDYFEPMLPIFADIAVDDQGIVTVIESQTGRIYQYDPMGNLITVFGGSGEQRGMFRTPTAIEKDADGNIYVLDAATANIQVFAPTEFVQLIHKATIAYNDGRYEDSYAYWRLVLNQHENYRLAHRGIANAFYKRGYMAESMAAARLALERGIYSRAFDEFRYEIFREYFLWIVIGVIVGAIALVYLLAWLFKKAKATNNAFIKSSHKMGIIEGLLISFYGTYKTRDALETVRYNKPRLNMTVPLIILGVAVLSRIIFVYFVHFALQRIDPTFVNPLLEVFQVLIIPVTWVVAAFAVTSIFEGETKPKEIFWTAGMGMFPYIIINLPATLISHILSETALMSFRTGVTFAYIWCFIIYFLSIKELNDFSFKKSVAMTIIIVLTMLLIWLVLIVVYVLVGRLFQFSFGLYNEAILSWF